MAINVKIEFLGGLKIISDNVAEHKCSIDAVEGEYSMNDLIEYVTKNLIKDPKDTDVFLQDGTVRQGILVLINDTDWELEGQEEYIIENGDVISFTSTLHGG